jgi:hypothetical protein
MQFVWVRPRWRRVWRGSGHVCCSKRSSFGLRFRTQTQKRLGSWPERVLADGRRCSAAFVHGERVRIKGLRDTWRVDNVIGRTATVVRDREDVKEQRVCVPLKEMTLVGEWAHVWHVFNYARNQEIQLRQVSAPLVALSGTVIAMRTRSIVELYLDPA